MITSASLRKYNCTVMLSQKKNCPEILDALPLAARQNEQKFRGEFVTRALRSTYENIRREGTVRKTPLRRPVGVGVARCDTGVSRDNWPSSIDYRTIIRSFGRLVRNKDAVDIAARRYTSFTRSLKANLNARPARFYHCCGM